MEFKIIEKCSNMVNKKSPTLCLNMIVKNESKIILRLLASVLPIIDCYCICDTGSSDDTVEKIEHFFNTKNIPGRVVCEPFKDFAYNRNFALKSCLGMSDYVILLDADMVLKINNFNKEMLNDYDSINILQGNDDFYYQNLRIVKNNGLFSYFGVTHEYINTPSINKNKLLDRNELFIIDIGDGGAKHDKFDRDIKLLTKAIEEDPNNDRYNFYLANTYHDSCQFEKAIEIYRKRIQIGGWDQEVWYSHYRIGNCYRHMGRINDAICEWLVCFDYLPQRVESLYEIVTYYRNISKHKLANQFYKIGKEMIKQNHDRNGYLFLHNDIYTFKLDYELTIFGAYIGIKDISEQIINILNNSNDNGINSNLLNNMKWYKNVLTPIKKYTFDEKINVKLNNETTVFNSTSSCLIQNNDVESSDTSNTTDKNCKYKMNIRYVNYYITENGSYINCEKNIITANKYIELDNDFNILKSKHFDIVYDNRLYIGVEDVRIFCDNKTNKLRFMGTGYHANNFLGIVEGEYDINNSELVGKEITQNQHNSQCEKNWTYVDYNNSTHIIYKWYPLQICKLDKSTNKLDFIDDKVMPKYFAHARGSTSSFKYTKDCINSNGNISISYEEIELWFIQHIVSYESPRHYYHIISVFDEKMNLLRYSAPFKFEGDPIEYCLSIVVEDDRVLINYSNWDRTTRIGVYDKKYIDSLLIYK
jgi:tetratricopeptide (TPR) repeat protein